MRMPRVHAKADQTAVPSETSSGTTVYIANICQSRTKEPVHPENPT